MNVTVEKKNNVAILQIEGDINITSMNSLEEIFSKLKGTNNIILQMEKVLYIDSSGLGFLIEKMKNYNAMGGGLYISNPSSNVLELFSLANLNEFFSIFNNLDEALESIKSKM